MSARRVGPLVATEGGSMLPLVGALVFTAIVVVALLAELAMLQVAHRSTASRADRVAEGAAAMLDEPLLRSRGLLALDPGAARARAIQLAEAEGIDPSALGVEVAPDRICITLTRIVEPGALRSVGAQPTEVRVRSCATPEAG